MTDLLLAEELFLLIHDDETGKQQALFAPEAGLAGALLLDCAAAGLVRTDGTFVKATDATATGAGAPHPLLAATHAAIADADKPRDAGSWIGHLQSALRPLAEKVGGSLAERGVLEHRRGKLLGMFPTQKWPEVDPGPERALRSRLRTVLVDGAEPDVRTAQLISLLVALQVVGNVVEKGERKAAAARAKVITDAAADENSAISKAVGDSVRAITAAIITAVIVPTVIVTN